MIITTKLKGKVRICAQCKQGENKTEADVYVKGRVPADSNSGWRPYQAYLCGDHVELMLYDGAEFPIQHKLPSGESS